MEIGTMNIDNLIESMTEDEALKLYSTLAGRFGWKGTFFTREDAESEWQNQAYDDETGLTSDRRLPDDVWERIQDTYHWRRGLSEMLTQHGWDIVHNAVWEVVSEDERDEEDSE
jgi:hypothetical protein